jgi:hypothetical protein
MTADFLEHIGDLIGFDRQHQDDSRFQDIGVEGRYFRADFFRKRGTRGLDGIAGDDLFRFGESGLNESPGQSRGHFAGSKESNG